MTLRLAVWSGPRNISTAMMRAWENREDCEVLDEPFYAYYLKQTGLDHPAAQEVMASQSTDWRDVIAQCLASPPNGSPIFYQKQMTFHLLETVDRGWLSQLTHCFLIREPESVVASYARVREAPTLADLGFEQQLDLFEFIRDETGVCPLVIDSRSFLNAPRAHLNAWCTHLGISFCERMLSWPAGPRESDGVWAPYWYSAVWQSTGFAEPRDDQDVDLPQHLKILAGQARPFYDALYQHRFIPQ